MSNSNITFTSIAGTFTHENNTPVFIPAEDLGRFYGIGELMQRIFEAGVKRGVESQTETLKMVYYQGVQQGFAAGVESQRTLLYKVYEAGHQDGMEFQSENLKKARDDQRRIVEIVEIESPNVKKLELENTALKETIRSMNETAKTALPAAVKLPPILIEEITEDLTPPDLEAAFEKICNNPDLFLPYFERLFLNKEKVLPFLNKPMQGKAEELRSAVIPCLTDHESLVQTLASLKSSLKSNWKKLKVKIALRIEELCPTVKDCLMEGFTELANQYVLRGIKGHVPGSPNIQLINDLSLLAFFSNSLLLLRDRTLELFAKDPELLKPCENLFSDITFRIHQERPEAFLEWVCFMNKNFMLSAASATKLSPIFAEMQTKQNISDILSHRYLQFWSKHGESKEKLALWLCFGERAVTDPKIFAFVCSLINDCGPMPEWETEEQKKRLIKSAQNVLYSWLRFPEEEQYSIGHLYIHLWDLIKDQVNAYHFLCLLSKKTHISKNQFPLVDFFIKIVLEKKEVLVASGKGADTLTRCLNMLRFTNQEHPEIPILTQKIIEEALKPGYREDFIDSEDQLTRFNQYVIPLTKGNAPEETQKAYKKMITDCNSKKTFKKILSELFNKEFSEKCLNKLMEQIVKRADIDTIYKGLAFGKKIIFKLFLDQCKGSISLDQYLNLAKLKWLQYDETFPPNDEAFIKKEDALSLQSLSSLSKFLKPKDWMKVGQIEPELYNLIEKKNHE